MTKIAKNESILDAKQKERVTSYLKTLTADDFCKKKEEKPISPTALLFIESNRNYYEGFMHRYIDIISNLGLESKFRSRIEEIDKGIELIKSSIDGKVANAAFEKCRLCLEQLMMLVDDVTAEYQKSKEELTKQNIDILNRSQAIDALTYTFKHKKLKELEKLYLKEESIKPLRRPMPEDYEKTKIVDEVTEISPKPDMVNHPAHYNVNGFEVIDIIKAFTDGLEGIQAVDTANAIKYILRWHRKNGVEDLKKAKWYIEHLIKEVENV